jgi:hypothetical protein
MSLTIFSKMSHGCLCNPRAFELILLASLVFSFTRFVFMAVMAVPDIPSGENKPSSAPKKVIIDTDPGVGRFPLPQFSLKFQV